MFDNISHYADTKRSAIKSIYTAYLILKENGLELRRKDLLEKLENRLDFEEWEQDVYPSNNSPKWLTIFLFYTIDSVKAGFLLKQKGIWYLTPEGEKAMELGPEGLFLAANKGYWEWDAKREKGTGNNQEKEDGIDIEKAPPPSIEELQEQAKEAIGAYIDKLKEFEYQHLCAVLLKAMGYYIDFEAKPGKDGGLDIVAFKDPLGYEKPYLKVQVKHYKLNSKVDVKDIRSLKGLLHAGEDIGVFICSGHFTRDAEIFARETNAQIKLINREDFIELWQEYYENLEEDDKKKLPLQPIYFIATY